MHIHFILTDDDKSYLPILKTRMSGKCTASLSFTTPSMISAVEMQLKSKDCKSVATTDVVLLNLLLDSPKKKATLDDYAGSIIERRGIEFLILNPLQHLVTVSTGKFLFDRYLRKFLAPEQFITLPTFAWELFDAANTESLIDFFAECDFIACDIETGVAIERMITCIGFCGVRLRNGKVSVRTVVVPYSDDYNVAFASAILELPNAKCFQNGKYDNAYLMRYGQCTQNWALDTQHFFHSWYSELPKRLDFITSFMLRKWEYWKDEHASANLETYYGYNAKDCYVTAMVLLALLREAPPWAMANYLQEFPLVFPCLLSELTGVRRDAKVMDQELQRFEAKLETRLEKLQTSVGHNNFNPSSPVQVLNLMHALGNKDLSGTTPKDFDKARFRHPLNELILTDIAEYRKDRKLVSAYLKDEDTSKGRNNVGTKSWHDRIFYSLNPHATDTGRLSSKESAFWCGWQIQNIPRDRKDIQIKAGIIADEDFYFGEADYSQNEARGTAYLSGDLALIEAVDDPTMDYHGRNAADFFGVPYEKIVRSLCNALGVWTHETLDKELRDLSKRTNHGANYNMGEQVMLDTMGIKNVLRARTLLGLPRDMEPLKVCGYLLGLFAKKYHIMKGEWYDKCKADVAATSMLVGPTGWTRYCFGNPSSNKRDLNRYVAHPPQSLAAMMLNKAVLRVFQEIWIPHHTDFKFLAQIHDSLFFQYRIGKEWLAHKVADCMRNSVEVKDTFGIVRTLNVPVDLKGGAVRWSELKALSI